jgi:GST-like protein
MIRFYFHPTPNPAKVALMFEETGLVYQVVPVDTSKGEQHTPEFRAVNPNGKVPAIVDTDGPGGKEARGLRFHRDLALPWREDRASGWARRRISRNCCPGCSSLRRASGRSPGQAVHFQHAAPEKLAYAINRYRREVERHYEVLDTHLKGREFIVGKDFTIADISAWGWLERAPRVLPSEAGPLAAFPNIDRWYRAIDARPAVARARAIGKDHTFKKEVDDETRRALFPSNYPKVA